MKHQECIKMLGIGHSAFYKLLSRLGNEIVKAGLSQAKAIKAMKEYRAQGVRIMVQRL